MYWQGMLSIKGYPAMPQAAWVKFVKRVRIIAIRGHDAHHKPSYKASLTRFNFGTEEEPAWYSDEYIVAANFPGSVISAGTIKAWLVEIFEVNPNNVTFEIGSATIRDRPTTHVTYAFNGNDMLRVAFFGVASSGELCSEKESEIEAHGWVADSRANWGPGE